MLLRHGCRNVADLTDVFADAGVIRPTPLALADRGDILLFDHHLTGVAAGLSVGEYGAFVDAENSGLLFIPLSKCVAAFAV
jgi:hypothetical protein